ncbi:NAD(P)-dependent oxidoreductase [Bradyrhizobium liaoningense]
MTRSPIAFVSTVTVEQETAYLEALSMAMDGEELRPYREMTPSQRAATEIAIVANPLPMEIDGLPSLMWIQSLWAGVERLVLELGNSTAPIVRLVDPSMARTMAESVLAWVYFLQREMPAYRSQQAAKLWRQHTYRPPSAIKVGLLGHGVMGAAAAARLKDAGFGVAAWSRSLKEQSGIQTFTGADGLAQMLSISDIIVCLLPLTAQTRGLMDATRFAQMKPGAALINFARGPIVVTKDLVAALDQGRLSHAVLGQRFRGSNHIRLPQRACRTKCG